VSVRGQGENEGEDIRNGKDRRHKEYCKGCELCTTACALKLLRMGKDFNKSGYYVVVFDDRRDLHRLYALRGDLPGRGDRGVK